MTVQYWGRVSCDRCGAVSPSTQHPYVATLAVAIIRTALENSWRCNSDGDVCPRCVSLEPIRRYKKVTDKSY